MRRLGSGWSPALSLSVLGTSSRGRVLDDPELSRVVVAALSDWPVRPWRTAASRVFGGAAATKVSWTLAKKASDISDNFCIRVRPSLVSVSCTFATAPATRSRSWTNAYPTARLPATRPAIFQWLATPLRSAVGSAVMLAVAVRCVTDHNVPTVAHPSDWWANDTAALRYAAGHCSGREWGGCDVWQWPP